jgi:hypothetical protein
MDTVRDLTLANWLFRTVVMLIGLLVMFMGYRMFSKPNALRNAGTLDAGYGGGKITLRGGAGTFFVVLGAAIMLVGLLRPTLIDYTKSGHEAQPAGHDDAVPSTVPEPAPVQQPGSTTASPAPAAIPVNDPAAAPTPSGSATGRSPKHHNKQPTAAPSSSGPTEHIVVSDTGAAGASSTNVSPATQTEHIIVSDTTAAVPDEARSMAPASTSPPAAAIERIHISTYGPDSGGHDTTRSGDRGRETTEHIRVQTDTAGPTAHSP